MKSDAVKQRRIKSFLLIAREEIQASEKLSADQPRQAAYFLQQAVEKLVRAALEHADIAVGVGHNIQFLSNSLPQGHSLKERFFEFDDLSPVATRFRYPSSEGHMSEIGIGAVQQRLSEVKQLEREVLQFLGGGKI